MGKKLVRVGDVNDAGGRVLSGNSTLRVNNRDVAVDGSPVSGHGRGPHSSPRCRASVTSVQVQGKRLIWQGDVDTCGHRRRPGSPDTEH